MRVILCDLGGVLIKLNWLEKAKKIFYPEVSPDVLKQKWLALKSSQRFECGQIDLTQFLSELESEVALKISKEELKEDFLNIIGPEKENCPQILDKLNEYGTLALLSNTNKAHIDYLKTYSHILNKFEHVFLSYELKTMKPSPEIYNKVIQKLGVKPQEILFFDDSLENIESAKAMGINAFQVFSPSEILEIVKNL
jgi:putative hydrolase of the HAD superfamily